MVYVAEDDPVPSEYVWLSVVGGPEIVSVVPSPQFTVVVAIVPSESVAVMVMTIACPDVAVVADCVSVIVGDLSMIVTVCVETFVEPLLSVTLSFTEYVPAME